MKATIEARLRKLEQALGGEDDPTCVIFSDSEGVLRGYGWMSHGRAPIEFTRKPGESEDNLLSRAKAAALPLHGVIALYELRG